MTIIDGWPSVFLFMTTWTLVLVIFHRMFYQHIDLLFLTFIVMFMGLYFTHINPKYFVLHTKARDIKLDGAVIITVADLIHILPFFVVLAMYGKFYAKRMQHLLLLRTMCILLIYYVLFVPSNIYLIGEAELFSIFAIAFAVYIPILLLIN